MARLFLPASAAPANWQSGSTPWTTLYGTNGNDQLAANASNMTLVGNGGDDTFIVYDPSDVVVQTPNSGVSTVETWGSGYTLSANVQNLTLMGAADAYAIGNSLNNIITANAGNDTITAGTGNDILIGGTGSDTFIVAAGDGLDEIQNFQSGDVVDLQGFSFNSFADVQAAMTQSGTDTVLNLGNGQSITFDTTTTASLTANEFNIMPGAALADPPPTMTFDDEFNSLSLNIGGQSGTWSTTFWDGSRSLYSNEEDEAYMDPYFSGTSSQPLGINPFSINNGILTITAQPTNPADEAYFGDVGDLQYTSGLLTTNGTFAQTYGYWEIRAQVPSGDGLWPGFWLLPANHSWPPEIDILEMIGSDPSTVYDSYHSTDGSAFLQPVHLDNLSTSFHTFGFAWSPSTMTWYVDGAETAQIATPADMNTPMYMLINLAVGGNFPGWPDATTQFPANFNIDYVHVYSDPSAAPGGTTTAGGGSSDPSAGATDPATADPTVSDDYQALSVADGNNIVSATGIYDTVTGGAGADTITATGWGDAVIAGSGPETISLSAGNGWVIQGSGQDTISLSGDNDTLSAGAQGSGLNQALISVQGNWFTFVDGAATYADTVVGFDQALGDSIHLTGTDTQSYALAHATQVNGGQDTLMVLNDGSTILLKGVSQIDGSFFS